MNLIFVISPTNKNSFAALCGALDLEKVLADKISLKLVSEEDLLKTNFDSQPVICFSFQTPDVFRIQKLIGQVRQKFPKAILVAGGAHSSGMPQQTLAMGFDFVFVGEGEEILIDFLKKCLSGKVDNEKIKKGEPVEITEFLPVSKNFKFFTPIEITRGCPHGCRFCQTTYLFGRIRHRTVDQIVESTKILVDNGWSKIRFVSPNILSYPELERMLASVRKVRGVAKIYAGSFPSEVRPENATKAALLILKKYADNDNLIIGFQSGSDRILKAMHRGHTALEALTAIEAALDVGFRVNVDFIFGNPGETREDEEKTIEILGKLAKLPGVKVHGHTFLPLPGTPWQSEKPGKISGTLRESLKEIQTSGKLYGDWEGQEQLAQRITSLQV